MAVTSLLATLLASGPSSAATTTPDPYSPGVGVQGFVGLGMAHRHVAPLVIPDRSGFYRLVTGLGLRVRGVPARAPTIDIGAEARFHVASTVDVVGTTSERPRGRTLGGSAWAGTTWWPRSVEHRFGLGSDLGYTAAPFVIASNSDPSLGSYGAHGPAVGVRLEGKTLRDRLLVSSRLYLGLSLPYGLEVAAISRPAAQTGVMLQTAVRIHGPLHLALDVLAWNVHLQRTGSRPFDDHVLNVIGGVMLRSPRP